jgi:hypothetical protein
MKTIKKTKTSKTDFMPLRGSGKTPRNAAEEQDRGMSGKTDGATCAPGCICAERNQFLDLMAEFFDSNDAFCIAAIAVAGDGNDLFQTMVVDARDQFAAGKGPHHFYEVRTSKLALAALRAERRGPRAH